jgi:hypothetical protein
MNAPIHAPTKGEQVPASVLVDSGLRSRGVDVDSGAGATIE